MKFAPFQSDKTLTPHQQVFREIEQVETLLDALQRDLTHLHCIDGGKAPSRT